MGTKGPVSTFCHVWQNNQNNNEGMMTNRIVIESTFEANIFWLSLIVADLIWAAFFLISFFTLSFKWMVTKGNQCRMNQLNWSLKPFVISDNHRRGPYAQRLEHVRFPQMPVRIRERHEERSDKFLRRQDPQIGNYCPRSLWETFLKLKNSSFFFQMFERSATTTQNAPGMP